MDPKIDLYYVGTGSGRLVAGPQGGGWRLLFVHPNSVGMNDIQFDAADPSTLYASFGCGAGGMKTGRVWRMTRTSANPTNVQSQDITANLDPSVCVNGLATDRLRRFTVYAAACRLRTDRCTGSGGAGVYVGRSSDQGATWRWERYGYGLPDADFRDLELHPHTGVMRATTWGRSAFEVYTHKPEVFIEVTLEKRTAQPNGNTSYTVRVVNTGDQGATFILSLQGLPASWYSLAQSNLTLVLGQEAKVPLALQLPQCASRTSRIFKVTAVKLSDPNVFESDTAILDIELPTLSLSSDGYETNDDLNSAKKIALPGGSGHASLVVEPLNLHHSGDVDYFEIDFQGDSKAECPGTKGGPVGGSFGSAFAAYSTPGSFTIQADEEFCRPLDIEIFDANQQSWGQFSTADPISISCPTDKLGGGKLYVRVYRKEMDKVRYKLRLSYSQWSIDVRQPFADPGLFRYPYPPELRVLDPRSRYFEPRSLIADLEEALPRFMAYRADIEEADLRQLEGLAVQAAGQSDAAENLLLESAERFAALGHTAATGDVWRNLGRLRAEMGRLEEAQETFAIAEELHAEAGDAHGRARDLMARAEVQKAAGQLSEALSSLDRGLDFVQPEDFSSHFEILSGQFDLFLALEQPEAAIATLLVLREFAAAVGDPELAERLGDLDRIAEDTLGPGEVRRLRVRFADHAEPIRAAAVSRLSQD